MASTTQDELYRTFLAVSGQQTPAMADATLMLADVIAQIGELRSSTPAQVAATNSQTAVTKSEDSGSTLGGIASTVLKSGFGLAPMISGLVNLFGGGDAAAPPALVKYAMPTAVDFQAAENGGRITNLDYDQMGLPRGSADALNGGTSATANGAPQITVNVQAMDARSFLDRSNDIALAVRDAMLNMNAINDVVNEL
jgi:hypothetical protein